MLELGLGPVVCLFCAGEPLSPMSAAKQRGEHYTVKEPKIPGGYLCLHCGLGGDIRDIRAKTCTPSPSPVKAKPNLSESHETPAPPHEMISAEEQGRYLRELEQEEASLSEMILLQQLQMEQAVLEALMVQQQAERLALKAVQQATVPKAKVPSLAPQSTRAPEPVIAAPEPMEVEEAQQGSSTLIEKCAPPPDPVTLASLPYGILVCNRVGCTKCHLQAYYTVITT